MGENLVEAILSGVALGGVLAVAAAWSRALQRGVLPHVGVGAVAGLGVTVAQRAGGLPVAVTVLVLLLAGVVAGDLAARLDRRVRAGRADPKNHGPPFLAGVAVLGGVLAVDLALRPPLALPLPFGPLGGRPGVVSAVVALTLGAAAAWMIGRRVGPTPALMSWRMAAAATVLTAALAGAALGAAETPQIALPAAADTAGLAFRAAAAALLGRAGPLHAGLAGLGLGVAEGLLWLISPTGQLSILPALAAATLGFLAARAAADRLERGTRIA